MAGSYGKAASLCASARRLSDKPQYARLSARGVLQVRGDSVEKAAVSPLATAGRPRGGLDTGLESKKRPDTVETHGSAAGRYYLQVGAFAAVENAQGLKNELSRRFSKVSVTTGASGGRQVFRVRVGAFVSKETAQAFGDSALVKKGMTFRVVEE
jgi:cell division protein FtsN